MANGITNVKYGTVQVNKIYSGTDLVFEYIADTTAPITTIRPVDATNNPTNTYTSAQTVYFDVNEMCDTYYTLDGTTPTTASTKYVGDGIVINNTTTIKYFSVDTAGNTEAVKTTTYTITVGPTTTISPSTLVQNTIPITVTLTSSESGATIYYKKGTGAQVTYTGPFTVNQSDAGVLGTQITITYWSVGASATETQKTITYDTSGSQPATPVLTATAGQGSVALSWTASQNATSYTVYKSTTAGTQGTIITATQYMTGTSYTDTGLVAGTTYYYQVRASNYGHVADSVQKSATPTGAPALASWRYLKIEGYGSVEEAVTTRLIEFEAWQGTTNRMTNATILSNDPVSTGGAVGTIKDGLFPTSGYTIWWTSPAPNGNVVVDLGASYPLDTLKYYSYSTATVPRNNRFRILASNTNNGTDWTSIWDNSTAQLGVQPALPSGYTKTL